MQAYRASILDFIDDPARSDLRELVLLGEELFDLASDPLEGTNLIEEPPQGGRTAVGGDADRQRAKVPAHVLARLSRCCG